MRLDIYVNYRGNCEEAFRFYEQHLGGRVTGMMVDRARKSREGAAPSEKGALAQKCLNDWPTRRAENSPTCHSGHVNWNSSSPRWLTVRGTFLRL